MPIASVNPATGQTLQSFQPLSAADIRTKLARSAEAFSRHRETTFADRAARMMKAAEILDAEQSAFGAMMTSEMGKTLASAKQEAAKCAWVCRYYAEHAARFLADEAVATTASRSFVRYDPLGPVLAVMPWNFPFWQVFRFIAPSLMAGNVGLLKHASNVPQCALAIEDVFLRAGFPDGVFQTLLLPSAGTARVIESSVVPRHCRGSNHIWNTSSGNSDLKSHFTVSQRLGARVRVDMDEREVADLFTSHR